MQKTFLCMALLAAVTVNAQIQSTIRVTGTRFTFPVFTKWADEYNKIHPEVKIIIASGIPTDSADIVIASHVLKPGDVKAGQASVALARYVQLPVVNNRRADLEGLLTKGLSDASFRQIYFPDKERANDSGIAFTVYKRQKAACSSVSFANHFGYEHKDIKGTGVPGDDQDLLQAVKINETAISHNSLGIIYNLRTRKPNDSIAVVPIDLNGNGKVDPNEKIYSTVDEVVAFVEKTNHPKIPVENINVIFSKTVNHKAVISFLEWVIKNGNQFNHAYGLLNLGAATMQSQEKLLALSNGLSACTPSFAQLKNKSVTSIHKNQ